MEFHERINYTKYASGETLFEYACEVEGYCDGIIPFVIHRSFQNSLCYQFISEENLQ